MRCARCGADVKRAGIVGSTTGQTSMFDVVDDARATPGGLADVRAGLAICGACVRQVGIFDSSPPPSTVPGETIALFEGTV